MAFSPVFDRSKQFLVFDLGDPLEKVIEHIRRGTQSDYVVLRRTEEKTAKPKYFILAGDNFFKSIDIPYIADLSLEFDFDLTLDQVYGTQIEKIKPAGTIQYKLIEAKQEKLYQFFSTRTPVLELHDDKPVSVLEPTKREHRIQLPELDGVVENILRYLPVEKRAKIRTKIDQGFRPVTYALKPDGKVERIGFFPKKPPLGIKSVGSVDKEKAAVSPEPSVLIMKDLLVSKEMTLAKGKPVGSRKEPRRKGPVAAKGGGAGLPPRKRPGGASEPPPVPPLHVYAHVDPEPEHVVQRKMFTITVSLKKEKSEKTEGDAYLPDDKKEHTIKVHLLLRENQYLRNLVFQSEKGTIQPAVFKDIPAPELLPAQEGSAIDRQIELLKLNFYLENRWCGEALRNIEILKDDSVEPGKTSRPQTPHWRKELSIEPGAERPDLLVRIQETGGGKYTWWLDSPHLDCESLTSKLEESQSDLGDDESQMKFVRDAFERFADEKLNVMRIVDIEGSVGDIYKLTPLIFRLAYWKLFEQARKREPSTARFESIQFVTDEPYIPWELMRLYHPEYMPKSEILALRHSVGRWIASSSCLLRQTISVSHTAVFASDYKNDGNTKFIRSVNKERSFLEQQLKAKPYKLKIGSVHNFLEKGNVEAVHFSCHGVMDQKNPDNSAIRLEDDEKGFRPRALRRPEVEQGLGKHHPFVFLNACQLGGAGKALNIVTGWPQAFIASGASAFISPLWTIVDTNAAEISREFYLQAKKSATLGETLKNIRQKWKKKKNLTYLAYVLYGDPRARIYFSF